MFVTHAISDAGARSSNEDTFGHAEKDGIGCWLVADGLGGHGGGLTAATIVRETVLRAFRDKPACSAAAAAAYLTAANEAVLAGQKQKAVHKQMRSTAALLLVSDHGAVWAHAGDTRLYLFHNRKLLTRTLDHSVPQMLVSAGQLEQSAIRFHEDRNRLLKSLGSPGLTVTVNSADHRPAPGDIFLLCSDGFWELVDDAEMQSTLTLATSPVHWLDRMEGHLRAQSSDNMDNYTALAVWLE